MAPPAQTVYSDLDNDSIRGTLFKGIVFYILQRVPSRSTFIQQVTANGGRVTKFETQAEIKIDDHLKLSPTPDCYSYTWIEQCLREARLVDKEPHLASRNPSRTRNVSSSAPIRSGRVAYTKADDAFLWRWVEQRSHDRAVRGNEIYQELERVNDRHTWQSWRDRYIKFVSQNPPSDTDLATETSPSTATTAVMAPTRTRPRVANIPVTQADPPASLPASDVLADPQESDEHTAEGNTPSNSAQASHIGDRPASAVSGAQDLREATVAPVTAQSQRAAQPETPQAQLAANGLSSDGHLPRTSEGNEARELPDGRHYIRVGDEDFIFSRQEVEWLCVEASSLSQMLNQEPRQDPSVIWDAIAVHARTVNAKSPSGRLWMELYRDRVDRSVERSRSSAKAVRDLELRESGIAADSTPEQLSSLRKYNDTTTERWPSQAGSPKRKSAALGDDIDTPSKLPSPQKRARVEDKTGPVSTGQAPRAAAEVVEAQEGDVQASSAADTAQASNEAAQSPAKAKPRVRFFIRKEGTSARTPDPDPEPPHHASTSHDAAVATRINTQVESVDLTNAADDGDDDNVDPNKPFAIFQDGGPPQEEQENAQGSPERQARRQGRPDQRVAVFTGEPGVQFHLEPTTEQSPPEDANARDGFYDLPPESQEPLAEQTRTIHDSMTVPPAAVEANGEATQFEDALSHQPSSQSSDQNVLAEGDHAAANNFRPNQNDVVLDGPVEDSADLFVLDTSSPSAQSESDGDEDDDFDVEGLTGMPLPQDSPVKHNNAFALGANLPQRHYADTQALLEQDTQLPDLAMPLPDSSPPPGNKLPANSSSPEPEPVIDPPREAPATPAPTKTPAPRPKPVPGRAPAPRQTPPPPASSPPAPPSPTPSELGEFIEEYERRGRDKETVVRALSSTSGALDPARRVLAAMRDGGELPRNIRGCWTDEDDADLQEGDVIARRKLLKWHGEPSFRAREKWLAQ